MKRILSVVLLIIAASMLSACVKNEIDDQNINSDVINQSTVENKNENVEPEDEFDKMYDDICLINWRTVFKVDLATNEKIELSMHDDKVRFYENGEVTLCTETNEFGGTFSVNENGEISIVTQSSLEEKFLYVPETETDPSFLKKADENGYDVYYAKFEE